MSVMVRRNAENMALCPFHGENRGSIPLGRAKEISSVTTSTLRLSQIAQDGATPALVTALMVAVRRVVEDTKT